MKRVGTILTVLALAIPLAAHATDTKPAEGKDLCLVDSENCTFRVDSFGEKIARLRRELAKGTSVYTAAELARLEQKLQDYRRMAGALEYRGN
jgi:hypothetical protein